MPWARAVIRAQLGAALLDWWSLSPLEAAALAAASRGDLTDAETAEQERTAQREIAAQLRAAFPVKKQP